MARDFAREFYRSRAWRETRDAYARFVGGLCERCLSKGRYTPGDIVHHRVHLTPDNICDQRVSLSFGNLELLCRACHAEAHPEVYGRQDRPRRVGFDDEGNVFPLQGGDHGR